MRLLIAGTHSGVGKTTVALGLLSALRKRGLTVQPFKVGPDYIDPGHLSKAAGRICRNLDSWLIPGARLPELFLQASLGAQVSLVEGVMGLYDGVGPIQDQGSTAEMAKLLDLPVLLVIDAQAMSRSAAALVKGFKSFDPKVRIIGCFLNRVAGPGHFKLVKEGIEKLCGLPVVGFLSRDVGLSIPERHLGLTPTQEVADKSLFVRLGKRFQEGTDMARLLQWMKQASVRKASLGSWPQRSPRKMAPMGVAMDPAFHFYYPENLELLEKLGAEVVPFSPLKDKNLPRVGALYLGGGFPEVFAPELSGNRLMRGNLFKAIQAGMPTYAECGGLMYLAGSIQTGKGRRYPMVGALPAQVRMTDRLQNFGYQQVQARRSNLLARAGEKGRGHEFHHSALRVPLRKETSAYQAVSRWGAEKRLEGYSSGCLLASYIHLHFWSCTGWAERFVQAAWKYKNNN